MIRFLLWYLAFLSLLSLLFPLFFKKLIYCTKEEVWKKAWFVRWPTISVFQQTLYRKIPKEHLQFIANSFDSSNLPKDITYGKSRIKFSFRWRCRQITKGKDKIKIA